MDSSWIFWAVLVCILPIGLLLRSKLFVDHLRHLPGPAGWPVLGNALQLNFGRLRFQLAAWAKAHGPVYRVCLPGKSMVIVSSNAAIREALLSRGADFAGRPYMFRMHYLNRGTGIVGHLSPTRTFRTLKTACERRIRDLAQSTDTSGWAISALSEDMFETFKETAGTAYDPVDVITLATLRLSCLVVTGQNLAADDTFVADVQRYTDVVKDVVSMDVSNWRFLIMDMAPWLVHLPLPASRQLSGARALSNRIWGEMKARVSGSAGPGLAQQLLDKLVDSEEEASPKLCDTDVAITCVAIHLASISSVTSQFYASINVLAHHPHIQHRLHTEISSVIPPSTHCLPYRDQLPYTQATVLEIMRYVTVNPVGIPHVTLNDTEIQGLRIPKGTIVMATQWLLHHDPEFWGDPTVFRPERFLDDSGILVPLTHPRRQHLIPFGLGVRSCPGERLAIATLFFWITTLVSRYWISPAPGNHKSSADVYSFEETLLLKPTPFKVIFKLRSEQ